MSKETRERASGLMDTKGFVYLVTQHGRYTVVDITKPQRKGKKVVIATGIARCSDDDLPKFNPEVGEAIARSKALRALYKKETKKKLHHCFQG